MTTQAPAAAGTMNLLSRVWRVTFRSAAPEILGVTLKEFVILMTLDESERVTQQRLAKTLLLDANSAVLLLSGLEDKGMIERTRDPEDRRRHIVEITPKGKKALAKAEHQLETVADDVLANLDQTERGHLHDLLAKALEDHSLAI